VLLEHGEHLGELVEGGLELGAIDSTALFRWATVPVTLLAEASSFLSSASREAMVRDSRLSPSRAARTCGGLFLNSVASVVSDSASWSVSIRSVVVARSENALMTS